LTRMLRLSTVVVVMVVFAPGHAWAWGPITHLAHGASVLADLTIVGVGLQRLLRRHRLEYLYGCVGPDITQAKKYTRLQQAHCHSWAVGWAVLQRAATDAERAFAWGYLTHLAGDVYSHNHFVPTQLIVSFRSPALRHIYWEARFDAMQNERYRSIIRELRERRFPECDHLVETVVARTLFSFRTDKRIFDSFIAVHDFDRWHRVMRNLSLRSRVELPSALVSRYNAICHANVVDLLANGKRCACQAADPTGMEALALAKTVRRTLKALQRRRGGLSARLQRQIDRLDARDDLAGEWDISLLQLSVSG
jgi:hypothetical protein